MSIVCESFGCTPDEAAELSPRLVYPVLDYRLAQSAKDMVNAKQSDKMSEAQAEMLASLGRLLEEHNG